MPDYLKPMAWPRPVPALNWIGDYSDIRERIQRHGYLDVAEQLWPPESGDGWQAFIGRHGDHGFEWDWMEAQAEERARILAARQRAHERAAEEARIQQERWEAAQRSKQAAKQAQADREWREIEEAKRFWGKISPAYASQAYRSVAISGTGLIGPVTLYAGKSYWLPATVADSLRRRVG